jgi:hypothetical protein
VEAVLEQLQKSEDFNVGSGASSLEFWLIAPCVRSCCGCGTWTVWENPEEEECLQLEAVTRGLVKEEQAVKIQCML